MNASIESINGLWLSLSSLSREFGVTRETVARRLAAAGVESDKERNGHPVFRVGPAARALTQAAAIRDGKVSDPDELPPLERRAWYQSEQARQAVELSAGNLVTAEECRTQMARIVKATSQVIDTLPDILERDCGLSSVELEAIENVLRQVRQAWADDMAAD